MGLTNYRATVTEDGKGLFCPTLSPIIGDPLVWTQNRFHARENAQALADNFLTELERQLQIVHDTFVHGGATKFTPLSQLTEND